MRFDMGDQALPSLIARTGGSHDDLGSLIRQLIDAAAPLEGKFNGAGKAAFDGFKARVDQIAADLNSAVASILAGQHGMHTSFVDGDQAMSDTARGTEGSASFDAASFRVRP
jgi:uncharacterized protein YukE